MRHGLGAWVRPGVLIAIAGASAACAATHGMGGGSPSAFGETVLVNRRVVPAGTGSVLDLLRLSGSATTLQAYLRNPGDEPLAVMNGVRLSSLSRLHDVPAVHVHLIEVLSPRDASRRFGVLARGGAIVVVTR